MVGQDTVLETHNLKVKMPKKCNSDELLIRIDERVHSMYNRQDRLEGDIKEIKKSQEKNSKALERLKVKIGIIIAVITAVATYIWDRISRMFP